MSQELAGQNRARILIVDDSPDDAELISRHLRRSDIEIEEARAESPEGSL